MANLDLMRNLARSDGGKIILLVLDGLGGLPRQVGGPTELEAADTLNMDRLAYEGSTGLTIPIARGVEPGSGPAHLAMFGYDPLGYDVGRGPLEASGIGMTINPGDVAARGNFCTVDDAGLVTDRRAGRIPTEQGAEAVAAMRDIMLPGVELELQAVKEHRFVMRMRGEGLDPRLSETDPLVVGKAPLAVQTLADNPQAKHTADLVNDFITQARERLKDHAPANMILLRGFDTDPGLPQFQDVYKLNPACVAVYPMYKGVSRLVGMEIIPTGASDTPQDEFEKVAEIWDDYDFVFCHIKATDSRGEDGDFDAKVAVIEAVDQALPTLLDLKPDVVVITG